MVLVKFDKKISQDSEENVKNYLILVKTWISIKKKNWSKIHHFGP
jgi:hypothetical protein